MVANKHISKIILAVMAAAVVLCFLAIAFSGKLTEAFGGTGVRMEYESKLFDTDEIISINIQMDEDEWSKMLQGATSEEYYVCNVVINGKRINNVAIRPKGNTSLSAIAMDPETDRYSLKLEFDHFTDGQTCFGLDKLILNNNYADATNMKEAVIYDMFQYIGAEASLYNYAKVSLNGEYLGVYLALEGVEESFMLRNFGTQDGELYKPDSMEMGGNSGGMGGFSMGNGGANLNYTDDDLDSYSTIWDGEITGTGNADHRKVVTALKNISEGTDLETYLDVDNVLKYMAVHVSAVNMDSLSGSMAHNYYLYEYDGQLNLFPWDYNLSLGGMSMGSSGDATEIVNDAIDTPFSGTKFFDTLLSNEEYLERYHAYLQQLVDEYVKGGRFEKTYNRIRSQIDSLVETDPTAFYDYEEYQTAVQVLYETINLRAESIDGQLSGTIPSTDDGQRQDSSSLIDASHIDIKAMGQFNMGGNFSADFGGFGRSQKKGRSNSGEKPGESSSEGSSSGESENGSEAGGFSPGNMPDMGSFDPGNMPDMGDFDPNNMPDMGSFDPDNMPDMGDFDPSSMPDMSNFDPGSMPDMGNFDPGNMPDMGGFDPGNMPDMSGSGTSGSEDSSKVEGNASDSKESKAPAGFSPGSDKNSPSSFPGGMPGQSSGQAKMKNLITYGICLAVMLAALLIINRRRRK